MNSTSTRAGTTPSTTNCTTSIRTQQAATQRAPWDWRILLNGKGDELMFERGALATGGLPFAELKTARAHQRRRESRRRHTRFLPAHPRRIARLLNHEKQSRTMPMPTKWPTVLLAAKTYGKECPESAISRDRLPLINPSHNVQKGDIYPVPGLLAG